MSAPRASVLLPVRDGRWLAEALQSLAVQTEADHEVCLQLDGADEAAERAAADAARTDPRVRVERGPPRGIVDALTRAAARARADLLVRMDADDICEPTRLARLLEHSGADFLASRVEYVPREGLSDGLLAYERWINGVTAHDDIVAQRFVECPLPHPAWAIRRDVFESLGGYRDGPFPEDYELVLRAADAGVRFGKVDEVLLRWRDRPDRLSRTDPRYALDAFFALKVKHLVPVLRRETRRLAILGTTGTRKRWVARLAPHDIALEDVGSGTRRDTFVLVAVGRDERDAKRHALADAGFVEGADFLCVQ